MKIKFNPVAELLRGKRIVLIEDSLVRGTTLQESDPDAAPGGRARSSHADRGAADHQLVLLRHRHAHARGAAGVAHSVEEIRRYITADSLAYLSWDGLYSFKEGSREGFCDACFTGNYPVEIPRDTAPAQLHLFLANEDGMKAERR